MIKKDEQTRQLTPQCFIQLISDPEYPCLFSENCLRDDVVRPWGRNREQVNCYAVPIKVLLKETIQNFYVKEYRASLYQMAKESLPDSIFEYSNDVLKDALNNFESPYGMVAGFDKVGYDVCECVDDDNNEVRHFPCTVPSCVIVKTIYTAAESKRHNTCSTTVFTPYLEPQRRLDHQGLER